MLTVLLSPICTVQSHIDTYENEKITVTYYADSEATIDIPYAFDGNDTLVMNGMGYYRMNDDGSLVATPDQA